MDKIELIDRADVIADLKKQFAAVYKDTMLRPIIDDDPYVEVLAKSDARHMQLFLDGLEAYLMTRPTIDAAPVRRGEWVDNGIPESMLSACSVCGFPCGAYTFNFCPNCGAEMRGVCEFTRDRAKNRSKSFHGIAKAMAEQWGGDIRKEEHHEPED